VIEGWFTFLFLSLDLDAGKKVVLFMKVALKPDIPATVVCTGLEFFFPFLFHIFG
jgi:hypothetical protein